MPQSIQAASHFSNFDFARPTRASAPNTTIPTMAKEKSTTKDGAKDKKSKKDKSSKQDKTGAKVEKRASKKDTKESKRTKTLLAEAAVVDPTLDALFASSVSCAEWN